MVESQRRSICIKRGESQIVVGLSKRRSMKPIHAFIAFCVGAISTAPLYSRLYYHEPEMAAYRAMDASRADPLTLQAIHEGLEKLRTHPNITDWTINIDEENGIFETGWFRTHKGEIRLKAQVKVWGANFRVDVWQNVGYFFPDIRKTFSSIKREQALQEFIQEAIQARKAANDHMQPTLSMYKPRGQRG